MAREIGEINAGSMADIAFLLLIFFLVVTTMDRDEGVMRILPPPIEDLPEDPPEVRERDVFVVLANANDQLLVEGIPAEITELKDLTIEFMTNPDNLPTLPQMQDINKAYVQDNLQIAKTNLQSDPENDVLIKEVEKWEKRMTTIDLIGDYQELPQSAVISLMNDRKTSYELYVQIQDALSSGINQLRNDLSIEKFGKPFDDFDPQIETDKPYIIAVRTAYPQRVSEAEPK